MFEEWKRRDKIESAANSNDPFGDANALLVVNEKVGRQENPRRRMTYKQRPPPHAKSRTPEEQSDLQGQGCQSEKGSKPYVKLTS